MATDEKVKHNEFACPQCGHDFCGLASELAEALRWALSNIPRPMLVRNQNDAHFANYEKAAAALKKAGL